MSGRCYPARMQPYRPIQEVTPTRIRRVDPSQIEIEWRDGHQAMYPTRYLRGNCGCAHCVDERTGKRMVFVEQIPANIGYTDVSLVGNYAIQIHFSDGHNTGIFSYDLLRAICPCESCLTETP